MEKEMLRTPLETYVRPFPLQDGEPGRFFKPEGPDPMQWDIPLGLQSLQTQGSQWADVVVGEGGEYLHLSWMIAQLTHDAPGGPVENLETAPRRLAVQVSDLSLEQEAVLTEGGLQNIIKGSVLPAGIVRQRQRLWPYASGAFLSGHSIMTEKLPFAYNKIIVVQPGHRLRPPALESGIVSWTDSLNLRTKRRVSAPGQGTPARDEGNGKILLIELEPEGEFNPAETDPRKWIHLGYKSALRSMDVLQSALGRGGAGRADSGSIVTTVGAPGAEADHLGLNRLSVNPLASGGRQLLLDIVRISERDREDSSGKGAIASLIRSGFYSDLDVEWDRGTFQDKAMLVFDAKEKSKVHFRAGWNAALLSDRVNYLVDEMPERAPEVYGGLTWSEPFYIPFQGEVGAVIGGHRPGYEGKIMIVPIYPLRLELGVSRTHWEVNHPYPESDAAIDLGAKPVRFGRTLSEVFLKVFPWSSASLRTSIQRHEAEFPITEDISSGKFKSTDFQEAVFLGLGRPDRFGGYRNALSVKYRNLNRVNLIGQIKNNISSIESRVRFSLGDFRFTDQYFWSDQSNQELSDFDYLEAGIMDVFTFQDEYFLRSLRGVNFQSAKFEYCPTFGKAGLRLIVGAYGDYGPALFTTGREPRLWGMASPMQGFWEAQAGYATPLGALRAGVAAIEGASPFYFLRLGANLDLGFEGTD